MFSSFSQFVVEAENESYGTADRGLEVLYEFFEHLSEGGTMNNFEADGVDEPEEMIAIMAVAWLDLRNTILARKKES